MTRILSSLVLLAALALPVAAPAVQPDEILDDPELEARAREISSDIRCLVCRNESIDDSNAGLARDLRLVIRERVTEGDSNAEVKDFLVARYGEYVLLTPRFTAENAFVWLAGPALLVIGGGFAAFWLRRQGVRRTATAGAGPAGGATPDAPLSREEAEELRRFLREER